jgi:hypothetical protein|tara:strand:+ start:971 stop:1150 length:180 start_codon:yes stop_codon:yes gene_type:complete
MPTVVFPYTKKGEENARAAAKEYSGKYVSDKGNKGGVGAMAGFISSTKSKGKTRSKKKE